MLFLYPKTGGEIHGKTEKDYERDSPKTRRGIFNGLSDREACIYADIAVSTLYNYCKKHKEFSERKELLKDNIKMKSKLNVAHGIKKGDINLSLWYLERKCKDEFSPKQEITHSGTMDINNPMANLTTDELRKLIGDG